MAAAAALLPPPVQSANLQPADLLFVSSHRSPRKVVGDDRNAFLITEGGVLHYDYRKRAVLDNIGASQGVVDAAWSPSENRLFLKDAQEHILEYSPVFRRLQGSSASALPSSPSPASPGDLTGMSLGGGYAYLGDEIRDSQNRRVPVRSAAVFEYDNLWLLTEGFGAFLGSARRRQADPLWFGLWDPSVQAIAALPDGVWFGGPRADGGVVRANADLSSWKVFPAGQDMGFTEATVYDIAAWKGSTWLATQRGVVKLDPATGRGKLLRHFHGQTDVPVYRLHEHEGALYAGTEKGVAVLNHPGQSFQNVDLPLGVDVRVRDFVSKGRDLWAATQYGLFLTRDGKWMTLKDVSPQDGAEAYGIPIPSVGFQDTSLYWATESRVFVKPRRQQPRVLTERDRIFRIRFHKGLLFIGFAGGVTVFNTESGLWSDFRLADGIPGNQVQAFALQGDDLWVGTDTGAMRIRLKPYLP